MFHLLPYTMNPMQHQVYMYYMQLIDNHLDIYRQNPIELQLFLVFRNLRILIFRKMQRKSESGPKLKSLKCHNNL